MLLTVADLERESQISKHTWRVWIKQGRLPAIRAGRRVRVDEVDFRAFIAKCRTGEREVER